MELIFKSDCRKHASMTPQCGEVTQRDREVLAKLRLWFDTDFHLIDGASGDVLHEGLSPLANDWSIHGPLCSAVSRRNRAEFLQEDGNLVMLAIPFDGGLSSVVAVAPFVTLPTATVASADAAAQLLGLPPHEADAWMAAQMAWRPEVLLSLGQLVVERLSGDTRLGAMQRELDQLSAHLSKTYDEISLLHRLTQNLQLTADDETLARLALEWLAEVMPAEGLAIQLRPRCGDSQLLTEERSEPLFVPFGRCPLDERQFAALLDDCGLEPGQPPRIINRSTAEAHESAWPEVRGLVAVSMCAGGNCFGWLVAFNHVDGAEFGAVEGSLLSSVAAILGIHGGNAELYQQQREFFAGVVRALTSAIDAKDPSTCGHSDRVARVAVRLAEELGLPRKSIDTIYLSGLLHDVGKIGIDDQVLRKPGTLTAEEYEQIKTHAEIGFRILKDIKQLGDVLPVVLHHHEQWDGKGYPHGLAGESIPLLARIVAVADSFDAMSSDRPYRSGMAEERLDAILRDGAATQWDAEVIAAFFRARDDIREISRRADEPFAAATDRTSAASITITLPIS